MWWRDHLIICPGQGLGHIKPVAAQGADELGHWTQGPKFMRRKWFSSAKLARGINGRSGWKINNFQFGLVEVKHLPQLLGNPKLISAIFRWERPFITQGKKFLGVRLDIASIRHRQTQWSGAQDIGYKSELFAIPGIEIRAGARGDSQFDHGEGLRLHWQVHRGGGQVEPMSLERVDSVVLADTDQIG